MTGFAIYQTYIGYVLMNYEDDKITKLIKINPTDLDDFGTTTPLTDSVFTQLTQYFHRDRQTFDFPYVLRGTDFQLKVWHALLAIPYGETRSYKDIAIAIGNEKAYRAVGLANNKNPINIVVPCHRVIGSNGALTGYRGGIEMKEFLLQLEQK